MLVKKITLYKIRKFMVLSKIEIVLNFYVRKLREILKKSNCLIKLSNWKLKQQINEIAF